MSAAADASSTLADIVIDRADSPRLTRTIAISGRRRRGQVTSAGLAGEFVALAGCDAQGLRARLARTWWATAANVPIRSNHRCIAHCHGLLVRGRYRVGLVASVGRRSDKEEVGCVRTLDHDWGAALLY
jgi:hypothetical protein